MAHLEEQDAGNDEDQESDNPGRIEGVMEEFMVHLARAVKNTQAEEKCYYTRTFHLQLSAHKDFQGKETVKWQGGDGIDEGSLDPSNNNQHHEEPPDRGSQGVKTTLQPPFLNLDPFQWWHGVENVARVTINGESCMALLDNGAQINTITPKYISDHSLQKGPITNILGAKVACMELGNAYMRPLGNVIIQVQVHRIQGYDEDQIARYPNLWLKLLSF